MQFSHHRGPVLPQSSPPPGVNKQTIFMHPQPSQRVFTEHNQPFTGSGSHIRSSQYRAERPVSSMSATGSRISSSNVHRKEVGTVFAQRVIPTTITKFQQQLSPSNMQPLNTTVSKQNKLLNVNQFHQQQNGQTHYADNQQFGVQNVEADDNIMKIDLARGLETNVSNEYMGNPNLSRNRSFSNNVELQGSHNSQPWRAGNFIPSQPITGQFHVKEFHGVRNQPMCYKQKKYTFRNDSAKCASFEQGPFGGCFGSCCSCLGDSKTEVFISPSQVVSKEYFYKSLHKKLPKEESKSLRFQHNKNMSRKSVIGMQSTTNQPYFHQNSKEHIQKNKAGLMQGNRKSDPSSWQIRKQKGFIGLF